MADVPELLGGRYEVGELLGRGGMAEVHRGFDTRLGRPVAIKMLRSDLARDATFLSRFRREAQSAAALNHASIVAVYDHGEDHLYTESGGATFNIPYIVMEYVDGRTLREILTDRGQLEPYDAVRVMESVLDALAYSHRQGIVHRDIKPANVMIGEDGVVKVMDFGIARAMADANATVTATSAVIGTAQYLSPEQAQGHSVDARSDLYSAGCMLFELLTGRPPFMGDSPVSIAYQHVGEAPVPPSRYAEAVSDDLDAVVLHSLEKPRDERYQDATEFRADLQAVRLGRPVSVAARSSAAALAGAAGVALASGAGATEAIPAAGSALSDQTSAYDAPVAAHTPPPGDDDTLTRRERAEEERERSPGKWILLIVAVLAALGLLVFGLVNYFGGDSVPQVTVPSVVGAPEDSAKAQLTRVGFQVETLVAADDTVPEGEVVSQNPQGGRTADKGSTVRITVSGGPNNVEVPDLTGRTLDDAKQLLSDLTLSLGTVTEKDDPQAEKGQVLSSDPSAGVGVKPGTRINLVVASGKVEVPNVKGLTLDEAALALQKVGLGYEKVTKEDANATPDTIIAQDPDSSQTVDIGSKITLTIATSPTPTVTTTVSPTPTESPTGSPSPSGSPPPSP